MSCRHPIVLRVCFVVCGILPVAGGCDDKPAVTTTAPATETRTSSVLLRTDASLPATRATTPYDLLERTYAPFTDAEDPFGFPMKVRNLSTNPYRFWRGAKELFYAWAKTNTADWLGDADAFLRVHGDLHPGNLGLYHSQGEFGTSVAFGAVDFDESARLPFQIELLQGVVTLKLLAAHQRIALDAGRTDAVIAAMLEAYKASLDSDRSPTELLQGDPWVAKMLKNAGKRDYSKEIEKYVHKGEFVPAIDDKGDKPKELLRPVKGRGEFAEAIENALLKSPDGADLFKTADVRKKAVLDLARRTQLESAGSEGLRKYLVLLANKGGAEKRLILYLKQQIPSSAERVGLIPTDPRPAAQRSSADTHALSRPPVYFTSWCDWNGGSYRLSIKEPWSESLDGDFAQSFEDLKHVARIWGTVAGSVHRQGADTVARVKARLTADLPLRLRTRADAYAATVTEEFRQFTSDPRTREQIAKADAALRGVTSKAR